MTDIKGPAIDAKAFRVEGHCCGIRIPALMDPDSAGVRFDARLAIETEALEAAIQPAENPTEPPREGDLTERRRTPR